MTAQINLRAHHADPRRSGRAWAQMAVMLYEQIARPDSILRQPLVVRPSSTPSCTACSSLADHPYRSAIVRNPVRSVRSRLVETAVDIIEADAHMPLTVTAIAARSRGSVRALQQAFRCELDTTPWRICER